MRACRTGQVARSWAGTWGGTDLEAGLVWRGTWRGSATLGAMEVIPKENANPQIMGDNVSN